MKPEFLPEDRLLLLKNCREFFWRVVSNPKWDYFTRNSNGILNNCFNDYVEYQNCGVRHRMIRISNIQDYNIEIEEIKPEWILYLKDCET